MKPTSEDTTVAKEQATVPASSADAAPSMPAHTQPGEMLLEHEQIEMEARPAPGFEIHWERADPQGLLRAQQRGAVIVSRGDGHVLNEDLFLDMKVGERKCLGKGGTNVMSVYPAGAGQRAAEKQAEITTKRVFEGVEVKERL